MRRVPVCDVSAERRSLDERLRGLLAIKGRNLHHETPGANIVGDRDDDAMTPAQRNGNVGILEGGDEHERQVRVDQPIPGARARDDQRSRAEVIDLLALVDEAGADNCEGLVSGRSHDG